MPCLSAEAVWGFSSLRSIYSIGRGTKKRDKSDQQPGKQPGSDLICLRGLLVQPHRLQPLPYNFLLTLPLRILTTDLVKLRLTAPTCLGACPRLAGETTVKPHRCRGWRGRSSPQPQAADSGEGEQGNRPICGPKCRHAGIPVKASITFTNCYLYLAHFT